MKKIFTSFLFAALMLVATGAKAQFTYELIDVPRTGWCEGPDVVFKLSEVADVMGIPAGDLIDYFEDWTEAAGGNTNNYACNGFVALENQATTPTFHSEQYGGFEMDKDGNFASWNGGSKWGVYIHYMDIEKDELAFIICQNPSNPIAKGEVCRGMISINLNGGKATFEFTLKVEVPDGIDKDPVTDLDALTIVGETNIEMEQEPNTNRWNYSYWIDVPGIAEKLGIDPDYMDDQFANMVFAKNYNFADDKWGEITNQGQAVPSPGFYFSGGIYTEGENPVELMECRNANYGDNNLFWICNFDFLPAEEQVFCYLGQYPNGMRVGETRNADIYIVYGEKAYIIHYAFTVDVPDQTPITEFTKVGETEWTVTDRDPRDAWYSLDYFELPMDSITTAFSTALGREVAASEIVLKAINIYNGVTDDYTADDYEGVHGFWLNSASVANTYDNAYTCYYVNYLEGDTAYLALGNKPNFFNGGENVHGTVYLFVDSCYYSVNINLGIMAPQYTFETCEEQEYNLTVQVIPTEAGGAWEIATTSTAELDALVGATDATFYGVTADGALTTAYSVTEATTYGGGGFWMSAEDENHVAYAAGYTGNGAFAIWYYNGQIKWFNVPGLRTPGETTTATFYLVNVWDGIRVKINTTLKFVDHIISINPIGEEDLVVKARDAAGVDYDEVEINFAGACETLKCTEEDILENGVQLALGKDGYLTSEGLDEMYGFRFTADGLTTESDEETAFMVGILDGTIHSYVINDEDVDKVFKTTIYISYNDKLYAYNITIGDEATAITDVVASSKSGKTYDLSGRVVSNPAKGLYIRDGKKFIVK